MRTRMTRGSESGTGISRAHSSGTWSKPRLRAATAGDSASRAAVSGKMQLTTSSGLRSFLFMISRMSHSVAPTMASASLRSTVEAPRRAWSRAIAVAACQIALLFLGCGGSDSVKAPPSAPAKIAVSGPWPEGGTIPVRYTCSGSKAPPELRWSGGPSGTREIVVVMTDPDAHGFLHWSVFGLPAGAIRPAGGAQGENSFGDKGYGAPCPPKGDDPHRYVIAVYALGEPTGLRAGASPDDVIGALDGAVARGQLTGRFGR